MRITGGVHGGRKLTPPKGKDIRPTSDRMRLAIFNMLDSRVDFSSSVVADMFCGTGALGLESLSRGAEFAYFWDNDRRSLDLAKNNAKALKIETDKYEVQLSSALNIGKRPEYKSEISIAFLDPPYNKGLIQPCVEALIDGEWLASEAWLVLESEKNGVPDLGYISGLTCERMKSYGDSDLALYFFAG